MVLRVFDAFHHTFEVVPLDTPVRANASNLLLSSSPVALVGDTCCLQLLALTHTHTHTHTPTHTHPHTHTRTHTGVAHQA